MKPIVDRESSRIRSLYFFNHLEGNHDVAIGIDGGSQDIAHRYPGQMDLGAGFEAADIFENGPVFDVLLKEPFLLGHDQHHDQEGRQRQPRQRCRRWFHIFGRSCGLFPLGLPVEKTQDLGMGGVQKFLVGPLKGPLALVQQSQPVRHQFRRRRSWVTTMEVTLRASCKARIR